MIDFVFDWFSSKLNVGTSVLGISVLLIVFMAFRAYRSRIRGGKFEIKPYDQGFICEGDLGKFIFDNQKKSVQLHYKNKEPLDLEYGHIKNILFKKDKDLAKWEEFFVEDFDLIFDTMNEYADYYQTYTAVINTTFLKQYPIYIITQYRVKDLWDIIHFFQVDLLSMVGLYRDVDTVAQGHFQEMKGYFKTLPIEYYDHA